MGLGLFNGASSFVADKPLGGGRSSGEEVVAITSNMIKVRDVASLFVITHDGDVPFVLVVVAIVCDYNLIALEGTLRPTREFKEKLRCQLTKHQFKCVIAVLANRIHELKVFQFDSCPPFPGVTRPAVVSK